MKKYVVTTLDRTYCRRWITSWLGSLKEFAGHDGEIIIINLGDLPTRIIARLREFGCTVESSVSRYQHIPLDRFLSVAEVARRNPGIFLYWEADVYFQKQIAPAFDLATDKLVACLDDPVTGLDGQFYNLRGIVPHYQGCHSIIARAAIAYGRLLNTGFVGGPSEMWDIFGKFIEFVMATGVQPDAGADAYVLNAFAAEHRKYFSLADSIWNFMDFGSINDDVAVIHPAGTMKYSYDTRHLLFHNRFPDLYRKWHIDLISGNRFFPKTIVKERKGKALFFHS